MVKQNNIYFNTGNKTAPGYFSNAAAGMMYFPGNPGGGATFGDIIGDIATGMAAALSADSGGIFKGIAAGLGHAKARKYYNYLDQAIKAERENEAALSQAYGNIYRSSGVQGLPDVMPIGFDPDKITDATKLQGNTNTSQLLADSYNKQNINPGANYTMVDPSRLQDLMNLMYPRQTQILDSQQYPQSYQGGIQAYQGNLAGGLNAAGNPQPVTLPANITGAAASSGVLDTRPVEQGFATGIQTNNYLPTPSVNVGGGQPMGWGAVTDKDLYTQGTNQAYDRQFEGPYKQAQTKEILEGQLPYLGAKKTEALSHADLMKRTNPNLRGGGGSAIDPMLTLSRLTGQIDADINSTVDMINNINNNLSKNIKKPERERLQQEKSFYSRQLGTLFAKKQEVMRTVYPGSQNTGNVYQPGQNLPVITPDRVNVNTADSYLKKKGIK